MTFRTFVLSVLYFIHLFKSIHLTVLSYLREREKEQHEWGREAEGERERERERENLKQAPPSAQSLMRDLISRNCEIMT